MRPPLPPFTKTSAIEKVRLAEDAWNSRDPAMVALAFTPDSRWRNRAEFIDGRAEIDAFLKRKWLRELDYRLIKELWAFAGSRIAVRFAYEFHDDGGTWFSRLWQRELGIRRRRTDASPRRQHQRTSDRRARAQIPLATRPQAGRSSGAFRAQLLTLRPTAAPIPFR
jgi:uncharacterized protein